MSYRRLITWTRTDEPGTSLHAAGLHRVANHSTRKGWHIPGRPRTSRGIDGVARVLWAISADSQPNRGGTK